MSLSWPPHAVPHLPLLLQLCLSFGYGCNAAVLHPCQCTLPHLRHQLSVSPERKQLVGKSQGKADVKCNVMPFRLHLLGMHRSDTCKSSRHCHVTMSQSISLLRTLSQCVGLEKSANRQMRCDRKGQAGQKIGSYVAHLCIYLQRATLSLLLLCPRPQGRTHTSPQGRSHKRPPRRNDMHLCCWNNVLLYQQLQHLQVRPSYIQQLVHKQPCKSSDQSSICSSQCIARLQIAVRNTHDISAHRNPEHDMQM